MTYSVRVLPRAGRDFDAALIRMADLEGDESAAIWAKDFTDFLATLATNPRRYVLANDAKGLSGEVRHVTHRRDEGTAPHRLIYRVIDVSDDGPLVEVLHIRHGAARPITQKEAREIEAQSRE